jgi:hypothetical protein
MVPELGLIETEGFYGTRSINKELYGDWTGVRVNPNAEYDLDEGGLPLTPMIQINYSKYCRKAGLTLLNGEDIPYAVVKLKAEGESITKVNLLPAAGDHHAWYEALENTEENVNEIKANGETEYLIFDLSYTWEGGINLICLAFPDMAADATVYVEEIQLFTTKEEAYAYAGQEIPTQAPETEEPTTEAGDAEVSTEAKTEAETEAPAKKGCGAVVAAPVVALVATLGVAFVAKKKD